MDSTDRQPRVFLAIAEAGSLSKAAEQLDQTQSGLRNSAADCGWPPRGDAVGQAVSADHHGLAGTRMGRKRWSRLSREWGCVRD